MVGVRRKNIGARFGDSPLCFQLFCPEAVSFFVWREGATAVG
jgi:hypothetical protein